MRIYPISNGNPVFSPALVRPLVSVRPGVLLEVAPRGEELPAALAVAVEGVASVQSEKEWPRS